MKTLTFDIETIPDETMSASQKDEYKKIMRGLIKKRLPQHYSISELKDLKNLTLSVSPFLGKIAVIGLHFKDDDGSVQTEALTGNEDSILLRFWQLLSKLDNCLFISFNGLSFDAPFIVKRSMFHRIIPTNNSFLDMRRFSAWPHFDVKMILGDWDKFATGTLDLVTNFLGVPSPKEGKIAAKNVYAAYKDGLISDIADYCIRDVTSTYEVYSILKDYIFNPFKNKKGS